MHRYLVLFAREPAREAREKGFGCRDAKLLFAEFAAGWLDAARAAGATLVVSTPPEDRAGWSRELAGRGWDPLWISQRGQTFGKRLEETAKSAASLGGRAILVGGDGPPPAEGIAAAFEALEEGAHAVLAPSDDGGISLLGLSLSDLDLLRAVGRRRRDVFASLRRRLDARNRRVAVVGGAPDVDGRRDLRGLVRRRRLVPDLARLGRRVLTSPSFYSPRPLAADFCAPCLASPALRGPPAAA